MGTGLPASPRYETAWTGAVIPSLLGTHDAGWLPAPARGARSVVVLVCDGLGWEALTGDPEGGRIDGRWGHLAGMEGGPIDTTVPSTTATALTSLTTGRRPAEHGIMGYRMRVGGQVLSVLGWSAADGPQPAEVQPHPPFAGRQVPVVTRTEFRETGFTGAHLRGGRFTGWSVPSALVEHVVRLNRAGEEFVYAYYDGIDKVGHEFGPTSSYHTREVAAADALIGALLAELPSDCALVVTSDHGMVDAPERAQHDLDPIASLASAFAGESRFRSIFARAGKTAQLEAACREAYEGVAWVLNREQLADSGWLGGRPGPVIAGRLGDVVLAARGEASFIAPDLRREARLVGAHGSVTPPELRVPLLVSRGWSE